MVSGSLARVTRGLEKCMSRKKNVPDLGTEAREWDASRRGRGAVMGLDVGHGTPLPCRSSGLASTRGLTARGAVRGWFA